MTKHRFGSNIDGRPDAACESQHWRIQFWGESPTPSHKYYEYNADSRY
ncbi:hypothetical protein QWZ16_23640 [Vibrio ostreicida]|uniref:Uncharacterized protein n=1 Tax=Vibrio ostreicida TaxID=526588 RepID=A0ABT8BWU0_9VIBR|nr:hypothetical protein [Vibrio ostreicida]MDN3611128.1 hypothetical protein [Vibrio ostreicida]MDN3611263.1 hypothetical protein [Vibrio ostreicida]MDN3612594.1 hypothetical protein [Vibrio ostreicida]